MAYVGGICKTGYGTAINKVIPSNSSGSPPKQMRALFVRHGNFEGSAILKSVYVRCNVDVPAP